ncbi:MAG: ABC transporter permease [Planctomycetota bacterium]|jgi:lipopolysaccharide transport system permease protein
MTESTETAKQGPENHAATVIKPGTLGILTTLSEVKHYSELFYFLFWRDITVRYKQTILGALWIVIQPLISTVLFVFIRIMLKSGDGTQSVTSNFIMVFSSMVPWMFFANALRRSSGSLVGNSALITKVYFPRIIIPWSAALSSLVDYMIGIVIVGAFVVYGAFSPSAGISPGLPLLALPVMTALALVLAMSTGLFFSALNVRFRDIGFMLGFLIQMGLHASAVWWTMEEAVKRFPKWGNFVMINPFVGMMEGFRWSLLGGVFPALPLAITCGFTVIMLLMGYSFFMKIERTFADVI